MSTPIILGIDEVGRGPWAGPLVVGAVILGESFKQLPEYEELTDSKKLSEKKRQRLSRIIIQNSVASATGWVTSQELDQHHLAASLKLATRRAVKQVLAQKSTFTEIIIDGTANFLQNTPLESKATILKKADSLIKEVSAASIIAKVARDNYMKELAQTYPQYGFEKHVGYGTALHKKALLEHSICPEHRKSFRPIREILEKTGKNPEKTLGVTLANSRNAGNSKPLSTSQKGRTAENAVANHLKTQEHEIIAHNFKTNAYEIDLISTKNNIIFFTEVKYSQKPHASGTPLNRITLKKQQQMRFATECFLKTHPGYQKLSPILAVASVSGSNFYVDDWFTII